MLYFPLFLELKCCFVCITFFELLKVRSILRMHQIEVKILNTTGIKLLTFMILGACCAIAGVIAVSRLSLINHETLLLEIEMDAILAVAIGGNALSGGKFNMIGSVIGAYAIQALTTTLYAMKVPSTAIKAYKAVVIVLIVVIGSPVVKQKLSALWNGMHARKEAA